MSDTTTVFRFDEFVLNVRDRRLTRADQDIPLGRRAMPLLLYLIEHRDRPISSEELLQEHWGPGATDQNLVEQTILRIRRKLGDDVDYPRYIQTIETVGYQFIAPLRSLPPENPRDVAPDGQDEPPTEGGVTFVAIAEPKRLADRLHARVLVWSSSAVLLMILAFRARPIFEPLQVVRSVALTQSNQVKLAPILLSSNSTFFQEQGDTGYRVVSVPLAGGTPSPLRIPLTNPELCDLSDDGQVLLLRSLTRSRLTLNPIYFESLEDGQPHRVGDVLAFEANWFRGSSKSILYSTGPDVYVVGRDGREPRKLLHVDGRAYWFRTSPDGRFIRFSVIVPGTDGGFIWEVRSDGANPHRLWPLWQQQQCCGTWTRDGNYYLFQALVDGAYQVFAVREKSTLLHRADPLPKQLTFPPFSHRASGVTQNRP